VEAKEHYLRYGFVVSPPLVDEACVKQLVAAITRSYNKWMQSSRNFEAGTEEYKEAYDENHHDKATGWGWIFQAVERMTRKDGSSYLTTTSGDMSRFMSCLELISKKFATAEEKPAFAAARKAAEEWVRHMDLFTDGWDLHKGAAIGNVGTEVAAADASAAV